MGITPPDIPLQHGEVLLRPWTGADAPAVAAACSDPEIARWIPVPKPYTLDDASAYLARCDAVWRDGTGASFAVVGAGTGELLGSIELHLLGPWRASVGYWLEREARGRGIATRAVRLVSEWAFRALELRRVELTTDPRNHASQRVAERAGFGREGLVRRYVRFRGETRDSVVFALAPADV